MLPHHRASITFRMHCSQLQTTMGLTAEGTVIDHNEFQSLGIDGMVSWNSSTLSNKKAQKREEVAWKLRAEVFTPASVVRSAPMASWLETAPRLNMIDARSNAGDACSACWAGWKALFQLKTRPTPPRWRPNGTFDSRASRKR